MDTIQAMENSQHLLMEFIFSIHMVERMAGTLHSYKLKSTGQWKHLVIEMIIMDMTLLLQQRNWNWLREMQLMCILADTLIIQLILTILLLKGT